MMVASELLNFIENHDIASVPQTILDYNEEYQYLEPSDLEKIVQPQALSPLQEEMISYHCRLHHTPFPKLIIMAEQGEIPRRLAQLRDRCPICTSCLFGTAHKRPWRTKSKISHPIRKELDMSPRA